MTPFSCGWLLVTLSCCSIFRQAWTKTVMGIAGGEDYQLITTFCFTFPTIGLDDDPPLGQIHSQTIVSTSGHKFLLLNRSQLEMGLPCNELVSHAKVIEPLTESSKEVVAYDLTLDVEPSIDRLQIVAVIARCGGTISAEYVLEFTNPGGMFEQQFACSDQGLLSSYMLFSAVVLILAIPFYSAANVLRRRIMISAQFSLWQHSFWEPESASLRSICWCTLGMDQGWRCYFLLHSSSISLPQ